MVERSKIEAADNDAGIVYVWESNKPTFNRMFVVMVRYKFAFELRALEIPN